MKVIVFFAYLFFHLLFGGIGAHASEYQKESQHSSNHTPLKRKHTKFINQDWGSTILEDGDLDLVEEHLNTDDEGAHIVLHTHYELLDKWYLTFSSILSLDDQKDHFKTLPILRDHSSPIYIRQRVLRIWSTAQVS